MKSWLASVCLQRLLIPLVLLAGVILRQNGMSSLYLLLLLYNPFVPIPSSKTMSGHTGYYQKLVISIAILNIASTLIFQILLVSSSPYAEWLLNCTFKERALRYWGLVKLDSLQAGSAVRLLSPELIVLVGGVVAYWGSALLHQARTADLPLTAITTTPPPASPDTARKLHLLMQFGKYVVLASLCACGALVPSAISGVYYASFLAAMAAWACNLPLGRPFAIALRFLLPLVAVHIITIFLYQMQWAQELLPSDDIIPRMLGLKALVTTNCSDPRVAHLSSDIVWPDYANPVILVWLFMVLCYESSLIINAPLIRGRESVYRRGVAKRNLVQDSTGSVTISEIQDDNSKLDNVPEEEEEGGVGILEMIVNTGVTIGQLLAQSSYIATNIIMMAWSITYHSWLTFVLLLWAMVMWLMPNQRRAMLQSALFLTFYAQCLLVSQYIFGMDFTKDELDPEGRLEWMGNVSYVQIGFGLNPMNSPDQSPVVKHIIIKSLYTVMFWITWKQYNQEKWEARNQSTLADIASPLQLGVSAATGVESDAQAKTNQVIQKIGVSMKGILTKYWIWVVACILFGIGLAGDKITIFRVVYMALALVFILTFQLSWVLWRKMMYGFWLTVIIYSMLILIMTYTYQFENFDVYWEKYLHVNESLQRDIGMEKFDSAELFVKLLTPTFFVIITVIQLYYFHKDFLAISDIKSRGSSSVRPRVSQGSSTLPSSVLDESTSTQRNPSAVHPKRSFHFFQALSPVKIQMLIAKLEELLSVTIELVWLFLELHMLKLILFLVMLLAVYDTCAVHFIFVLLAVIATSLGTRAQTLAAHIFSVLVSILLLARMIYQIEGYNPEKYKVYCSFNNNSTDFGNMAEWIGFEKKGNSSLAYLLRGYIALIIVVTVHTVVVTRQKHQRHLKGRSLNRPHLMFPRISYRDVDKDIKSCVKYLFNYGFYRFGIEICLITIVILIGIRMDFYAALYSLWLCLIITPKRNVLAKIWPILQFFIIVSIVLQYLFVVGLPPNLCIRYPWEGKDWLVKLQRWMFLPVNLPEKLSAYKLLCDFLVLMVVSRQGVVFRIERRHAEREYHGGTNKSIISESERSGFTNPTPDFISSARSWLDLVKRVVFSVFIWVTLAIVFLAGTNRVNVFSLGYLAGAFIFLWQGNDFFLRPLQNITRWWNYLISYNVAVILFKTLLQIIGCVFISLIDVGKNEDYSCWIIQIIGVGCVNKFSGSTEPITTKDECSVPEADIGLAWDGFCFGFLILQRRLFNSYYFLHIVDETKAMAILASRGAELIEELSQKQIREQQEAERNILEKIKNKMDRIKASQQKSQGPSYKEPTSHAAAIRSGDYYMFDDVDEEELDLICEAKSSTDEEDDEGARVDKNRTDVFKGEKPGPSGKQPDDKDEASDEEEEKMRKSSSEKEEQATWLTKIIVVIKFLWCFINSLMVTITRYLNRFSRDYRYVMKTLTIEKKLLKERSNFGEGIRVGSAQVWQPYPVTLAENKHSPIKMEDIDGEPQLSAAQQPPLIRLLLAMWFAVISHSELVCYFTIFLHQIRSPTILSLPLPLMVFFWGTLTVPRPSKKFWVTIIAYTEVVVMIKCIFQFEFISWKGLAKTSQSPFYPPHIIGIERQPGTYAYYDLLLLLVVFFHRSMLKSLGLWKSSYSAYRSSQSNSGRSLENGPGQTVSGVTEMPAECITASGGSGDARAVEAGDIVVQLKDSAGSPASSLHSGKPVNHSHAVVLLERILLSMKHFFCEILHPTVRVTADVYAYMFFCDFINFLVIIFGFSSFGSQQGESGVAEYFEENKVPIAFLVMLILQFALIVIDRTLYLRKFILGKIVFQYILVIGIHIWMFLVLPAVTERSFNAKNPPQIWYIVKCIYLLLSAYQIRSGYPTRILGNFLCKSYNYINMFLFKVFMLVPFVFELRALMDWIWTDTSMTLSDWLKMEDIFAHLFQLKCQRRAEEEYPQPRGEKKAALHKYLVGGGCLVGVIAVIWFPLVLFALGNTVGKPNLPLDVTASVHIGAFQPIYQYSVQNYTIGRLSPQEWDNILTQIYPRSSKALSFLSGYEYDDIGIVQLSSHSTSVWMISPPDNDTLIKDLKDPNQTIPIRLELKITRISNDNPDQPGTIQSSVPAQLLPNDPARKNLLNMLTGKETNESVIFPKLLPKFIKVVSKGDIRFIDSLMRNEDSDKKISPFRNLQAILNGSALSYWWELYEAGEDSFLKKLPFENCTDKLVMYTFNDKAFPSTLKIISGKGIVGLYTTFVILIHSVIRQFFTGISFKIMFDDMPCVDRLLQLCLDIYLVRESGELDLEEDLFAKLVFLYRSPETLIKWTRPIEEAGEDDPENLQQ